MHLLDLPIELQEAIIELSLAIHPSPSFILCLNSHIYHIFQPILHRNLRFFSTTQLKRFCHSDSPSTRLPLSCRPLRVTIDIPGGTVEPNLFTYIGDTLERCMIDEKPREKANRQVSLDLLDLKLNSYSSIYKGLVCDSLQKANPARFKWTGPDPPHHFSIAIVSSATHNLFTALKTWSALQHLHLSNIAFPPDAAEVCFANLNVPSLRTVFIGQSTFLSPRCIAVLCNLRPRSLELVHLVDAYQESIWGPRLRRSDIESYILGNSEDSFEPETLVSTIRKYVVCEARTERAMGGDRADGEMTPLLN